MYAVFISFHQTLYASLQQMLEYEGDDLEDVFMQSFQVSYKDVFGCDLTHELKEKGADVHVNQENKKVSSQKWRQNIVVN